MKRITFILLVITSSAYGQGLKFDLNQIVKDTLSGRFVMSSLIDSSLTYESVLTTDGTSLFLNGSALTFSVDVDSVYLFGNGSSVPIYLDKQKLIDSVAFVPYQEQFTAIENDSSYTVNIADLPLNINNILVFQNGQVLDKNMFTKIGNTITLSYQPEVGDRVVVMWFSGLVVDSGGYVSLTGNEAIAGIKSFTDNTIFDTNTLFVDAVNNKVGVRTTIPTSIFEVNGSATNSTSNNESNGNIIDFSLSNISISSTTDPNIILTNIKDGGAYILILSATTVTTNAIFSSTDFTFKYMGTANRTNGKQHIYSFIVVGTVVYVTMATQN